MSWMFLAKHVFRKACSSQKSNCRYASGSARSSSPSGVAGAAACRRSSSRHGMQISTLSRHTTH
eukprot:scaffold2355_cov382-Prasinococcus_capsulatus_cf.AAC.4